MRRHRVIYTHGGGRLGNQIIRLLHWLAWTREHPDLEVWDIAFWPYARYFAATARVPGCVLPAPRALPDWLARRRHGLPTGLRHPLDANNRLLRIAAAIGARWPGSQLVALNDAAGERVDLESAQFLQRVRRQRTTVCSGWQFASWPLVARHQAALRDFLLPAPAWAATAARFVAGLRAQNDLLVGVLIRQGDYRDWNGGKFCFGADRYAQWMRELIALHPGRRVAFVVAADERQDPGAFAGLPVHFSSGSVNAGGDPFAAWLELAHCDLIASVPSTFSATAAFLRGIPLWPLGGTTALDASQLLGDPLLDAARHPDFSQCVR